MTVVEALRAAFDPRGRCNRKGLLYLAAILLTIQSVLGVMVLRGVLEADGVPLLALKVVFFWTAFIAASKRLHDIGRSAWWIGFGLIGMIVWTIAATVGALIAFDAKELEVGQSVHSAIVLSTMLPAFSALLWLHCRKGMTGPNRFGPQPGAIGFSLPDRRSLPVDAMAPLAPQVA